MSEPSQQVGWLAWLQANMGSVSALTGSFAVACTPFAMAYRYLRSERDDKAKARHDAQDKEAEREVAERVRQDAVDAAQVARLSGELATAYQTIAGLREDVAAARKGENQARRDADRGWWLARYWWGLYGNLFGSVRQHLHDMNGYVGRLWLRMELKPSDPSIDDMPKLPMPERVPGLEEPGG